MVPMAIGADLFVDAMLELGIHDIFTLVGDHLNDVLSVAGRRGIRLVDMRHESGVTHAADAFGRIHRRPCISLVTGGPGHTNSLTGIDILRARFSAAQLPPSPARIVWPVIKNSRP